MQQLIILLYSMLFWIVFIYPKPERLILFYILFLPLQDIFIMLCTNIPYIEKSALMLLMAAKEVLLFCTIIYLALYKKYIISEKFEKYYLLLLILASIYFLIPHQIFPSSLMQKLMGIRTFAIPAMLFLYGRMLILEENTVVKYIKYLVFFSLIIYGFGIIEVLFIPRSYYTMVIQELGKVNLDALRVSSDKIISTIYESLSQEEYYTRELLGLKIPRLLSFYMKPLTSAYSCIFPIILLGSIATSKIKSNKLVKFKNLCFVILLIALLLTLTRAVIVMVILMISLMIIKSKKVNIVQLVLIIAIPIIFSTGAMMDLVSKTISLDEPSMIQHIKSYYLGTSFIADNPLGAGLGNAGPVGKAYSQEETINESLYLTLAIQLGWFGAVIFSLFIYHLLKYLSKNIRKIKYISYTNSIINFAVYYSTIIFIFTSFTTETWFGFRYAGIYWIFLGILVTQMSNNIKGVRFENSYRCNLLW